MKGDLRKKTRPQGQDERVFRQDWFDGGQNSDAPAKKIRTNELALIRNAVAYGDRLEGGWGARLASDERYPGTGEIWDIKQHSVTGRWLMHRGSDLWLSAGRLQREWSLVSSIGPDGSLEAGGALGSVIVPLSGGAAAYLSAMKLSGVAAGTTLYIDVYDDIGRYWVDVYDDVGKTNRISVGSISNATMLPIVLKMNENGGSGVTGSVVLGSDPGAGATGTGPVAIESGARVVTYTGDAFDDAGTAFISNLVVHGYYGAAALGVTIREGSGGGFTVEIDIGGNLLCSFTGNSSSQPYTQVTLTAEGGMAVTATCDINNVPNSGYGTITGTISNTLTQFEMAFSLRGLTEENTTDFDLFPVFFQLDGPRQQVDVYESSAYSRAVATSSFDPSTATATISGSDESGITGSMSPAVPVLLGGSYVIETLDFEAVGFVISGEGEIESRGEHGFMVFARATPAQTLFVDQRTEKFWPLSEASGYPDETGASTGSGDFEYRVIHTFSRIVDSATGLPAYSSDRTTAALEFEGPGNAPSAGLTDYAVIKSVAEPSAGSPVTVSLLASDGVTPLGASAAAYATHISTYRTRNINQAGVNAGEFIWDRDVPIYETSYQSSNADAVLLARLEANIDNPIYRLQSRGFVPMDKGIGGIRDDFMFTSAPSAPSTSYCELFYAPRLIGYHNALQRSDLRDPISHIGKTAESMIVVCPSSVYQFTTSIYQDVGRGLAFIPIIGNRYRVSATTGVSPGNRPFVIDDSSFIAFCTDKTLRVFSGSQWGDPVDDLLVHKILENAETVVLGYIRGVILVWIAGGVCLRYAFGGDPGSKWSEILRDSWPDAQVAAVWEDDAAAIRLIVASDDTPYVVEDEGGRIYEDEVPEAAPVIRGTSALANISIGGWNGATLYGGFQYGFLGFFESEGDRDAWANMVGSTAEIAGPAVGVVIGGAMSGSIDVLSLDIGTFTVVDGIGVGSYARIDSLLRFRDLAATQDSFRCFHKSSYASMLFPYGMPVPQVRATWYGDGAVRDESVIVPGNGSIQSFKRIDGQRIQLELEVRGSGWQIDSLETKYQTHDARNANGPQNGPEALMQAELAQNMIAWLNGESGLRNRVGGVFVGPGPGAIEDPRGGVSGQDFSAPVNFSLSQLITDFSVMFWAKDPVTAANPVDAAPFMAISGGIAVAFLNFVDASTVDCGSFQFALPVSADDGEWHHYALTRDGSKFRVFQDGSLIGEATLSPGVTALIDTVRASAQQVFDPRLYDVRLSNEAVAYYYASLGGV